MGKILDIFIYLLIFNIGSTFGTKSQYRLSESVVPIHYSLHLKPNFYDTNNFQLSGNVSIITKINDKTDTIKLHSIGLTLENVKVYHGHEDILERITYNSTSQWNILKLSRWLTSRTTVIISIGNFYRSLTNNSNDGLYYFRHENKVAGAVSMIEQIEVRKIFPCFDELGFKATFDISIERKNPYYAISVSPKKRTDALSNSWSTDVFNRTPIIETSNLGFAIVNLKKKSLKVGNTNIIFHYPTEAEHNLTFGEMMHRNGFTCLNQYFNFDYPSSEYHVSGFPRSGFDSAGSYGTNFAWYENDLLYREFNETETVTKDDTSSAALIINGIIYQWFGSIISVKWWNDLWIIMGLSQYFSDVKGLCIEKYKPWNVLHRSPFFAMYLESEMIMTPVSYPWIESYDDILDMSFFSNAHKGSMIPLTAEKIMGEERFKNSMLEFMVRYKYQSVNTQQLLDVWNEFSGGKNMSRILTPWLTLPGFPVVDVKINQNDNTLDISQSLFKHTPTDYHKRFPNLKTTNEFIWPLPIQWMTLDSASDMTSYSEIHIVYNKNGTVSLNTDLDGKLIIVNPSSSFYYIVNYETAQWLKIGEQLNQNHEVFSSWSRAKIVFDIGNLFRVKKVQAETVNSVLEYLKNETDHKVKTFAKASLLRFGNKQITVSLE